MDSRLRGKNEQCAGRHTSFISRRPASGNPVSAARDRAASDGGEFESSHRVRGLTINVGEDIVTRSYESESFESVLDDLVKEIEVRNYRITRVYDIDNIFEQSEREIAHPIPFERYKIVEFCNLGSCVELVSTELLAGVFMPLRFIVYEKSGAGLTLVAFLKPTAFARQFDSPSLIKVATVLERDMNDVLEEMDF